MKNQKYVTPGYFGGKNPCRGINKWIVGIIGHPRRDETFVEPFAGMLGILLSRLPASKEIANDRNGDIVNWWLAVRDHPEDFAELIFNTPVSRQIFEDSIDLLASDESDMMRRALAQHVCMTQNVMATPVPGKSNWGCRIAKFPRTEIKIGRLKIHAEIRALADRMRAVQLENRDALDIIERTIEYENALLYCDPPYAGACIKGYGLDTLDRPRMAELLMAHKGRVAVSGYADNWDCLSGWNRHEFRDKSRVGPQRSGRKWSPRTEVLWTNFDPPKDLFS